jgi:PEP-CTERM motif
MKITKILFCAVAASVAFAAATAKGQNISATLIGITPELPITGTYSGGASHDYPSGVSHFDKFDGFCVEPLQALSYGQTYVYEIQNPATLANSDTIARLIGGYLASGKTAEDAAAVQWAIWETTNELSTGRTLLTGNVQITGTNSVNQSSALLANQYLSNVNTFTPAAFTYLTNPDNQDIVSWNAVPEPTSLGLLALSGCLLLRRRRR